MVLLKKVFPLAMIKIRKAESVRQRIIRQKETKQEKANRLQKNREFIKELRETKINIRIKMNNFDVNKM